DAGGAAGLLSGSQTISAVLGVATDAINRIDMPAEQRAAMINHMPVAYAVTYLFGTAGSAWLLASLGPRLLRVDLAAECKALEAQMGQTEHEPGVISAARRFDVRATNQEFAGRTIQDLAESASGRAQVRGVYLRSLTRAGQEMPFTPGTVVDRGDVLQIVGAKRNVERAAATIGYADRQTDVTD